METVDLVFPVISLVIAVLSILLSIQRASKSDLEKVKEDAVALEHRLTVLEQNLFSTVDRVCVQEISTKVGLLWDAFKTFPSFLKRESTPELDKIWSKAEKDIKLLTKEEAKKLLTAMDQEIKDAIATESNPARAFIATIYRVVFKYELEHHYVACK